MEEREKEIKKLYRSRVDRFVAGVCGGLGEYFEIDPNIFRILFVIFSFVGMIGLFMYLAAIIIIPENPNQEPAESKASRDKTMFWAILLIVLGILLLLRQMGFFQFFHFWSIPWSSIWAIFLIALGILLILAAQKKNLPAEEDSLAAKIPEIDKIYRSRTNRMIAGVCGGLAEYFKIDPSVVRLLWVLGTLLSFGLGVLVYVILFFVFPEKPDEFQTKE